MSARPPFWRNPFVANPEASTKVRRKRALGPRAEYFESRREAMKTLYVGGATLQEIADVYSVTRERARQVIAGEVKRGRGLDPIKTVAVCRKAHSMADASRELGRDVGMIRDLLTATGYWPAMHRLWEWRKRNERPGKWSDRQLLNRLRELAERLGHTPSMNECNADPSMPSHTTYVHRWGNWAPACIAAGLKPSVRGAHGHKNRSSETGLKWFCKRGHSMTDESNIYVWDGKRYCKACHRLYEERRRQRLIDAGQLIPRRKRISSLSNLMSREVITAREVA